MKNIATILIILTSLKAISQSGFQMKVTYKEKLNFYIPVNKVTQLVFNSTQSYYVEKHSTEDLNKKNITTVIKYNNKFSKIINVDLKRDSIFMKVLLNEKFFLVQERLSKIAWKIHTKINDTILGYKSTKATGYFRGRTYTAWFTEEIPTKFGPWKLNGLPGLILEVKDNLNQVQFIAEKIEFIKKNNLGFNLHKKNTKYSKISLKEFSEKLNENVKSKMQQIISRLPKGSKAINIKLKKHSGLEIKYEWEEQL